MGVGVLYVILIPEFLLKKTREKNYINFYILLKAFEHLFITMKTSLEQDLVLVTGATGFVASHVIKTLLDQTKYRVKGTVRSLKDDRKIQPLKSLFGDKLELVEADLLEESGWIEAVNGCKFVFHIASPFPANLPSDENQLIRPALRGTMIILKACVDAGVKRVVLTGSCSSIFGDRFEENRVYTEKDWPYFRRLKAYSKSKVAAERAAWEFVKEREVKNLSCFQLAVVNPGYVMVNFTFDREDSKTV